MAGLTTTEIEMGIIRSMFGVRSSSVSSTSAWPQDLGPWGKFENDPIRFVYDVLLEEYRVSREDIKMWTQLMNGMLSLVLAFWAATLALVQILVPRWDGTPAVIDTYPWLLLLLFLLGAAPGFMFLMWDIRSAQLSTYIQHVLKKRLKQVILSRSSESDPARRSCGVRSPPIWLHHCLIKAWVL